MFDLYDWRGFVVRTDRETIVLTVARKVFGRAISQCRIHKDGRLLGVVSDMDELYDLLWA